MSPQRPKATITLVIDYELAFEAGMALSHVAEMFRTYHEAGDVTFEEFDARRRLAGAYREVLDACKRTVTSIPPPPAE